MIAGKEEGVSVWQLMEASQTRRDWGTPWTDNLSGWRGIQFSGIQALATGLARNGEA
jgi:hypothetical protein